MRFKACVLLILILATTQFTSAAVTIEKSEQGAEVKIDGQLFTQYLTKSGNKPVLWPIMAAGGKSVTRGFPIQPQPGETNDHIHQRGLWFTHGDVNGTMFWSQEAGTGEIRHREFTKLEDGDIGTIATRNDWFDPKGKKVCEDERVFRFSNDGDVRIIDTETKFIASDGDVKFGDDKEGSFGLRLADSMRSQANPPGKIITSEGATNESAWGRPANWVDYHGPVDGKTVGVAILDHPSNHGHPVRWHVRPYGLFAANPFSQKAYDPSQSAAETVIPAGKSLTFKYRVVIHPGDEKEGKIEERYAEFAKP